MDQQYPMGPAEYPPDPPGPQAGTFPRGAKKTQCESPTCSLSTLSPSMVSSSASSRSSTSSIMSLENHKEELLSSSKLPTTSSAVNIKSQESGLESQAPADQPDLQNLSVVASGSQILLLCSCFQFKFLLSRSLLLFAFPFCSLWSFVLLIVPTMFFLPFELTSDKSGFCS